MKREMQENDDFEAMLDHTLRARAQATPRAGFPSRIAESLRQVERDHNTPRGWWNWLTASLSVAALAAMVLGSFAVLRRHTRPGLRQLSVVGERRNGATAATGSAPTQATQIAAESHTVRPHMQSVSAAVPYRQPAAVEARANTLPKLDTFPSPAPESDRPFGSGDPVVAVSQEAARAMLGLQQQQARPITLTALNINRPLFGESQ